MARKRLSRSRSYAAPRVRSRRSYSSARPRGRALASRGRSAPQTLRIVIDQSQQQQPVQLAAVDPKLLFNQPRGRRF